MTTKVDALPLVSDADRARINAAPRSPDAHRALMDSLPAMSLLEAGGAANGPVLPAQFRVAAWNLERGLFPEKSADLLRAHDVQVVLLSEMDSGMARTGQRNTAAAMAGALGMEYLYGVEFYEMDLGGPTERPFCKDDFNAAGWHGNAILSSAPIDRALLIRLDEKGHWFCTGEDGAADPEQPRVGGRMAIAAVIRAEAGPICFVSTHLESNADAAHRHAEFEKLLDAVDGFAPGLPVLIGGDLNTGNHMSPDFDWQSETLVALAEARGFDWGLTPPGPTTRPSLITPHPTRKMTLDWFCARDLSGPRGTLVPALDPEGTALSDHELILCEVTT